MQIFSIANVPELTVIMIMIHSEFRGFDVKCYTWLGQKPGMFNDHGVLDVEYSMIIGFLTWNVQ